MKYFLYIGSCDYIKIGKMYLIFIDLQFAQSQLDNMGNWERYVELLSN